MNTKGFQHAQCYIMLGAEMSEGETWMKCSDEVYEMEQRYRDRPWTNQ